MPLDSEKPLTTAEGQGLLAVVVHRDTTRAPGVTGYRSLGSSALKASRAARYALP